MSSVRESKMQDIIDKKIAWNDSLLVAFSKEYIKHDVFFQHNTKLNKVERGKAYRKMAMALGVVSTNKQMSDIVSKFRTSYIKKLKTYVSRARKRGWEPQRAIELAPRWMHRVEGKLALLPRAVAVRAISTSTREKKEILSKRVWSVVESLVERAKRLRTLQAPVVCRDLLHPSPSLQDLTTLYDLWVRIQSMAMKKLHVLLLSGDSAVFTKGAMMRELDWSIADLVLLYSDEERDAVVTEESARQYETLQPLVAMFHLAQVYMLDEPADAQTLARRWSYVHYAYADRGASVSVVLLQRRWIELKQMTRKCIGRYWRWPISENKPAPIYTAIAKRFPDVVTTPQCTWRELVAKGLVLQEPLPRATLMKSIDKSNQPELRSNKNAFAIPEDKTDSDDDIVLIEKDIETVDLEMEDFGSDGDDKHLVIDEDSVETQFHHIRIKQEIPEVDHREKLKTKKRDFCKQLELELDQQLKEIQEHLQDDEYVLDTGQDVNALHILDTSNVQATIVFDSDSDFDAEVSSITENREGRSNNKAIKKERAEVIKVEKSRNVCADKVIVNNDIIEQNMLSVNVCINGSKNSDTSIVSKKEETIDGENQGDEPSNSIDAKLLMDARVELTRVDDHANWKKYANRNTINFNQMTNVTNKFVTPILKKEVIDANLLKQINASRATTKEPVLIKTDKKIKTDEIFSHENRPHESSEITKPDIRTSKVVSKRLGFAETIKSTAKELIPELLEGHALAVQKVDVTGTESKALCNYPTIHKKDKTLSICKPDRPSDQNAKDRLCNEEIVLRIAKKVELPNIEEVRRINKSILTAQVTPIVTAAGDDTDDTLSTDGERSSCEETRSAPSSVQRPTLQLDADDSDVCVATAPVDVSSWEPSDLNINMHELNKLLKKLSRKTSLAKRKSPSVRQYCCVARRHRAVNDARRRIAARAGRQPPPPFDVHGERHRKPCDCCCQHLLDASTSEQHVVLEQRDICRGIEALISGRPLLQEDNRKRKDNVVKNKTNKRKRDIGESDPKNVDDDLQEWIRQKNITSVFFDLKLTKATANDNQSSNKKLKPNSVVNKKRIRSSVAELQLKGNGDVLNANVNDHHSTQAAAQSVVPPRPDPIDIIDEDYDTELVETQPNSALLSLPSKLIVQANGVPREKEIVSVRSSVVTSQETPALGPSAVVTRNAVRQLLLDKCLNSTRRFAPLKKDHDTVSKEQHTIARVEDGRATSNERNTKSIVTITKNSINKQSLLKKHYIPHAPAPLSLTDRDVSVRAGDATPSQLPDQPAAPLVQIGSESSGLFAPSSSSLRAGGESLLRISDVRGNVPELESCGAPLITASLARVDTECLPKTCGVRVSASEMEGSTLLVPFSATSALQVGAEASNQISDMYIRENEPKLESYAPVMPILSLPVPQLTGDDATNSVCGAPLAPVTVPQPNFIDNVTSSQVSGNLIPLTCLSGSLIPIAPVASVGVKKSSPQSYSTISSPSHSGPMISLPRANGNATIRVLRVGSKATPASHVGGDAAASQSQSRGKAESQVSGGLLLSMPQASSGTAVSISSIGSSLAVHPLSTTRASDAEASKSKGSLRAATSLRVTSGCWAPSDSDAAPVVKNLNTSIDRPIHSTPSDASEGSIVDEDEFVQFDRVPVVQYLLGRDPTDIAVVCAERDRSWLRLAGEYLLLTDRELPCADPTYWTLGRKLARIVFEDEQPQFVALAPAPSENVGKLKVKSFAKIEECFCNSGGGTGSTGGAAVLAAPDRVSFNKKSYKKLSDQPLVYALVLNAISDVMECRRLVMDGVPLQVCSMRTGARTPLVREPSASPRLVGLRCTVLPVVQELVTRFNELASTRLRTPASAPADRFQMVTVAPASSDGVAPASLQIRVAPASRVFVPGPTLRRRRRRVAVNQKADIVIMMNSVNSKATEVVDLASDDDH